MRIKPGSLPATEHSVEKFRAELLHQFLNSLRASAKFAPGINQVLFYIPLDEAALLVRDGERKLGFSLLRLRKALSAVTHPHAGRCVALCRDMGDGEFFHPLPP